MTETTTKAGAPTFFDRVVSQTPGKPRLEMCIQCGTCGGSCPSGADMDHSPRALFAMVKADMVDKVLSSNTPWYCVSCYYCTVRCPQEVHVTDLMYTLKRISIQQEYYRKSTSPDAPPFSQTFIHYVEEYGRSFELGLATWYHLQYHPLDMPRIMPMALGLLRKQRIDLIPNKIDDIRGLKSILAKAKELESEL